MMGRNIGCKYSVGNSGEHCLLSGSNAKYTTTEHQRMTITANFRLMNGKAGREWKNTAGRCFGGRRLVQNKIVTVNLVGCVIRFGKWTVVGATDKIPKGSLRGNGCVKLKIYGWEEKKGLHSKFATAESLVQEGNEGSAMENALRWEQ